MRAVVLNSFEQDFSGLEVKEVPEPAPKRGEVLIEVEVGSLSPSDDMMMRDAYFEKRAAPYVAGQMGVGRVVGSGGGLLPRLLQGKRVFFAPGPERGGTWADFAVADAMTSVPVGELSPQDAIGVANSLTVVGLFDTARRLGSRALVMNAAAGSVGRFAEAYSQKTKFPLIGIVRSSEQQAALRTLGARYCLNQNDPGFEQELAETAKRLGAKVAIDSVGGQAPRRLMRSLPRGSSVLSIGALSGEEVALDPLKDMMPKAQSYGVFVVTDWLNARGILSKLKAIGAARDLAAALGEGNAVRRIVSLEEAVAEMPSLVTGTSGGIALVSPSKRPSVSSPP